MYILSENPSIANQFISELRDIHVQKDRMRFRINLERLGGLMAYEISKSLDYQLVDIQTPLTTTRTLLPREDVVLFSILRASLPFYQGFLKIFDFAKSGFIGASRQENHDGGEIQINLDYHVSPSVEGKIIILTDPMLATGKSFVRAIDQILTKGTPTMIHIAAIFAAPEGIAYIKTHLKIPHQIWIGTLDDHLNKLSYIVPGCGDAGDLAFGEKL